LKSRGELGRGGAERTKKREEKIERTLRVLRAHKKSNVLEGFSNQNQVPETGKQNIQKYKTGIHWKK